ncbi:MAG: CsiV family protein [Pontibacterium sp.]
MNMILRTVFSLWLCILPFSASAEKTPWYQIEMLVFANKDPGVLDDEFWPRKVDIAHQSNAVRLRPPMQNAAAYDAYELLPTSSLLLNEEKQRITRHHRYRVLYHAGWLQPVEQQKRARPIHIQAGNVLDNGMYELEGYVTVDRGRYLHFKPDLYHSRKLSAGESSLLQEFLNAGDQPAIVVPADAAQGTDTLRPLPATQVSNSFIEVPEFLTVNLKQGRRMRSEEIHYLDHPLMGVMVLMLPVNPDKKF